MNRVKGKPLYRELRGEGSISAQADEAWDCLQSQSNSLIQDLLGGQLQSTVQCPHCRACSHKFDGFMDLNLPLPGEASLSMRNRTCSLQVTMLCNYVLTEHAFTAFCTPLQQRDSATVCTQQVFSKRAWDSCAHLQRFWSCQLGETQLASA